MEDKVKQYRKKPVVVEAVQWLGLGTTPVTSYTDLAMQIRHLVEWGCPVEPAGCWGDTREGADPWALLIPTLEGKMFCHTGDWIIRGIKGEFYCCRPDIFDATYEEVEEIS